MDFTMPDEEAKQLRAMLETLPVADPRFRWLTRRYGPTSVETATVLSYLRGTKAVRSMRPAELDGLFYHLLDYTDSVVHGPLDLELFDIAIHFINGSDRVEALLRRLGWMGRTQLTLQETAGVLGVTRERVRQLQVNLERKLVAAPVWHPALDRSITLITANAPLPESSFWQLLRGHRLIGDELISAEGFVAAARILAHDENLVVERVDGEGWILLRNDPTHRKGIDFLRTGMLKVVSRQGIVPLQEAAKLAQLSGIGWLETMSDAGLASAISSFSVMRLVEGHWILQNNADARSSLASRLRKMLAVWPELPISWASMQLTKDKRNGRLVNASDAAIEVFVQNTGFFSLVAGVIRSNELLSPENELSDSEFTAYEHILREGGESSFSKITAEVEAAGFTRVASAVMLSSSPVFYRPIYDHYRVIGHRPESSSQTEQDES